MPTYVFKEKGKRKLIEVQMKISELDDYKKLNPHVKQLPSAPAIVGDHISGAGPKVDSGFTENMQRIAESHPGTPLADRYGSSSTKTDKEIKTREVLKKHGVL